MAMKPGLRFGQAQLLTLTPGLRQSLHVLQMSAPDLAQLIEAELAENPLLTADAPISSLPWAGHDDGVDKVVAPETLASLLCDQIGLMRAPALIRNTAFFLAHNLNDDGYLAEPLPDLIADLDVEPGAGTRALDLLQGCEPTGIGARDLAECLGLQLAARGVDAETRDLILHNLSEFALADWPVLGRKTGLPVDRLKDLAEILQSLNPFPASGLISEQTGFLRPDIRITPGHDGGFQVEMVDGFDRVLGFDQTLFHQTKSLDTKAATYLQEQASRASGLIRAINARARSLARVAGQIAGSQHQFFTHPDGPLVPLTRLALAQNLGLHPSTVSRAVANKSLTCARGVYPLAFFFTSGLNSLTGQDTLSTYTVQAEIKRLITNEPPDSVLSDEQITAHLRQTGVDIARRTVAKYRQCLKIPSSFQRRKSKRNL